MPLRAISTTGMGRLMDHQPRRAPTPGISKREMKEPWSLPSPISLLNSSGPIHGEPYSAQPNGPPTSDRPYSSIPVIAPTRLRAPQRCPRLRSPRSEIRPSILGLPCRAVIAKNPPRCQKSAVTCTPSLVAHERTRHGRPPVLTNPSPLIEP